VAPMARGVSDAKEDRAVLAPCSRARLGTPRIPVDRVVRVLPQVGRHLEGQAICHEGSTWARLALQAIGEGRL
jgi:hypothetical protein